MKNIPTYRSSQPHETVLPRAHTDGEHRRRAYGPLEPMQYDEPPSWTARFCFVVGAGTGAYALYHVARAIGEMNLWFSL